MTKKELRKYYLEKRQHIPSSAQKEGIFNRNQRFLFFLNSMPRVKHLFVFYSYRSEPSTHELIVDLLSKGYTVSVPRMMKKGTNTTMEVVPIQSLSELTGVYQSIPQPLDYHPKAKPDTIDLVIVPSLAIDSKGYRLGYGGGFYDRLLSEIRKDALTIAWQYEDFCNGTVIVEDHDLPVQFACTEQSWHEF
ncbi:MAG: 5-formyltetrahydrofolate cyclo-ligase [Schleiferiaceae bacterium]